MYDLNIRLCVPGGCDVPDFFFGSCLGMSMNDNTGNFGIEISGGGATIVTFDGTVNSPYNGVGYTGALGTTTRIDYTHPSTWFADNSIAISPTSTYCVDFTIRTLGLPTDVCGLGLEGADSYDSFFGTACPSVCFTMPPLPVTLSSFTAQKNEEVVQIEWETATEQNSDYFEVERSSNGKDFFPILTINGMGNSSSLQSYSGVDINPALEVNFYRLRQVDFNGAVVLSPAIEVDNTPTELTIVSLAPQPATVSTQLTFWSPIEKNTPIKLFDTQGTLVKSFQFETGKGINTLTIDLSELSKGIYFLVAPGKTKGIREKIIKV